jgi:hypothetical protein
VDLSNFFLNGRPHGDMAEALLASDFDLGVFRPYTYAGKTWVTVTNKETGKEEVRQVNNVNTTMRYDDWRTWDDMLIAAMTEELGFVQDVIDAGLTREVDAMKTMVLSYERVGTVGGTRVVMDPLGRSEKDRPEFDSVDLPLPLVVADYGFGMRYLSVAKAGGSDVDTITGELKMREVWKTIEDMALGNVAAYGYQGKGSVYGIRTYPYRATKVLTLPTAPGWSPSVLVEEILDMKETARLNLHNGPYFMYISSNWETYLDRDYSAAYPGVTVRNRLSQIGGISGVKQLDKLTGYQIILVQKSIRTLRMIIGMQPRVIQWMSPDGFEKNFRIVACVVPQFFSDIAGNTGIVHGTGA